MRARLGAAASSVRRVLVPTRRDSLDFDLTGKQALEMFGERYPAGASFLSEGRVGTGRRNYRRVNFCGGRADNDRVTQIGPEFPQILAAAQEGAEWAWAALYHSVAAQLAGFARAKGAPEPDDVVGEVFHDVARNIHTFEGGEGKFRSWVFTIAHNRLVDQWRRASRRRREPAPAVTAAASAEAEAVQAACDGPAFAALERLTEAQRTVMLLRTVADLSLDEVAAVLGTNRNAVKALQHRAVQQLRKTLAEPVTQPVDETVT